MSAHYQDRVVKRNRPVKEPRARIIGSEPDRNIVASGAYVDDVPSHWILVVIHGTTSTSDDIEGVLMIINS